MNAPEAPSQPSPGVVAAAQTSTNVSSAIASIVLTNADEETPEGTVVYQDNGTYDVEEPVINDTGDVTGTTTRTIPRFKRVVALSATNQLVWDKQKATQLQMQTWAYAQAQNLTTTMSTTLDLTGARARGQAPAAPAIITSGPSRGILIRTIGNTDAEAERVAIEAALFDRINTQIGIDRSALVLKLQNQGLFPGSVGYERALREFSLQTNDARLRTYLVASEEQQRRLSIEKEKADFANSVQGIDLQQQVMLIELSNKNAVQQFQALVELANFVEDLRKTSVQELIIQRTQPMNEVAAVMHGQRLDIPQFRQYQGSQVQAAPVGQYVYQSAAIQQQQWQQKVQQQQQMFGAILSATGAIGGAALGAEVAGGGSLFGNWWMGKK